MLKYWTPATTIKKCTKPSDHHNPVSSKVIPRLCAAQQAATGGKSPTIAHWRVYNMTTPKQVLENDYTFFVMKLLEFWDGVGQLLCTRIEPIRSNYVHSLQ